MAQHGFLRHLGGLEYSFDQWELLFSSGGRGFDSLLVLREYVVIVNRRNACNGFSANWACVCWGECGFMYEFGAESSYA